MKRTIPLLLCGLALGCSHQGMTPHRESQAKPASVPGAPRGELTTMTGEVPAHDFAMPLLASELLPGSIQGCLVSTEPKEGIVVLYPKCMARPERAKPIQVKGQMQIVRQKPPSSPDAIQMRWYEQKVLIVTSWEYIKTGS